MENKFNIHEQLESKLKEFGYSFWDEMNLVDQGLTRSFKKEIGGSRVMFSYFWDSQSHYFINGTLRGYWDFAPENKFLHPLGFIEIVNILEEDINKIPAFENKIVCAIVGMR